MTTEKLKVISGAFSLTQSFPFSTRSVHKAKEKVVLNSFIKFVKQDSVSDTMQVD